MITALAPMAAVTNPPFRSLAVEYGCNLTVTEMVSSEALVRGGAGGAAAAALRMERSPNESVFVVQLFGGDPEVMAEAARMVESHGADVIDVNMGCPVRKIAGRCNAGVALMRDPPRAAKIISTMTDAVRVPVTAKIRAGWDDESINAPEVARALEAAGAAMISIHARTKDMGHDGAPKLEVIRDVKWSVRVPVLGNGGVRTVRDAQRMVRETGCDGVMIGRGAHGNPWIFRSMRDALDVQPSWRERFDALERHLVLYVQHAGEHRAVREFRKHVVWYLTGLPGCAAFRGGLGQLDSLATLQDALARYREAVLSGRSAHASNDAASAS